MSEHESAREASPLLGADQDAPALDAQSGPRAGADVREDLGRLVHETRLAFNAGLEKPFGLVSWEERHPSQRELDVRIGETVAAAERERLKAALRGHYLAGISCDHARKEDNPVCACSRVFLGWHPSVGEAVEAWVGHVLRVLGGGEGQERSDEKGPQP